jgi:hypothetical protein
MIDGLPPLPGHIFGARYLLPQGKGSIPKQSIMRGFHPMTSKTKQIIDGAMDGKENLRLSR